MRNNFEKDFLYHLYSNSISHGLGFEISKWSFCANLTIFGYLIYFHKLLKSYHCKHHYDDDKKSCRLIMQHVIYPCQLHEAIIIKEYLGNRRSFEWRIGCRIDWVKQFGKVLCAMCCGWQRDNESAAEDAKRVKSDQPTTLYPLSNAPAEYARG